MAELFHRKLERTAIGFVIAIIAAASGKYNMTLTALEIDHERGTYRYYSAGGLPVIRMRASGDVARVGRSAARRSYADRN